MYKKIKFKNEYALQHYTNDHLKELFNLKFITFEFQLNDLRIDGLAYDEKTKAFVILEYKNKLDENVVNQGKDYYKLLQNNKSEYIEVYNKKFNENKEEKDFDFTKTKVMIIGPEFSQDQIDESKKPRYPFELYKVTLYKADEKKGCVLYEDINSDFKKSINLNLDDLKLTRETLLKDKSKEIKELYDEFEERLSSRFNVEIIYLVDAVSIKASKNYICLVNVKKPMKIIFYTDELEDKESQTRDISDISTGGPLGNYELTLDKNNIDYAMDLIEQVYTQKNGKMTKGFCPVCHTQNSAEEKYCLNCGIKLIEEEEKEEILENKLEIPKDKIILLDLNYTLISNSWKIRRINYPEHVFNRQYEQELVNKIKDNQIILITASPYKTSFDSLKHIEEKTGLKISESYWNFGKRPPELKEYWLQTAVFPTYGDDPSKYLAIESNKDTRAMYKKYGIEARPKHDFI